MTLYRAATATDPHFGKGSYWSPSEHFARRFAVWLDETFSTTRGMNVVYRAEVDVIASLDFPFGVWVSSSAVTERVDVFAAAGYRWVTFHEGVFEGTTSLQFVYLGQEPIEAEVAT
jgi:hypothetical protein